VRFFKVADETQLVFRGGVRSALREVIDGALDADADADMGVADRKGKGKQKFIEGSMECVAMIDDHTFLSGGDSGYVLMCSKSIV
jgi:ribosomal RNA-processing protein 9